MFDNIVGIKCFIGANGDIEVKGSNMPSKIKDFRRTSRLTPSAINCFRFDIEDTGTKVIMSVWTVHECSTLDSVIADETMDSRLTMEVDLPHGLSREMAPFIVRMEDNNRQAVIDELYVHHKH